MTCPDIHKFHLTCWTFEFEITPATRNQTGLGYWLMLHTSFVFSYRCWTPKIYGRGQSPSLTHGCGMASHSWECSIHCISYVKTTCYKNCKNDHSWFFPKNFYFEIHCFRMVRNFCFEAKTWFAWYEPYWLLHGQIHLSMQPPAHCSLQLLYTLTLRSSWSIKISYLALAGKDNSEGLAIFSQVQPRNSILRCMLLTVNIKHHLK